MKRLAMLLLLATATVSSGCCGGYPWGGGGGYGHQGGCPNCGSCGGCGPGGCNVQQPYQGSYAPGGAPTAFNPGMAPTAYYNGGMPYQQAQAINLLPTN